MPPIAATTKAAKRTLPQVLEVFLVEEGRLSSIVGVSLIGLNFQKDNNKVGIMQLVCKRCRHASHSLSEVMFSLRCPNFVRLLSASSSRLFKASPGGLDEKWARL